MTASNGKQNSPVITSYSIQKVLETTETKA